MHLYAAKIAAANLCFKGSAREAAIAAIMEERQAAYLRLKDRLAAEQQQQWHRVRSGRPRLHAVSRPKRAKAGWKRARKFQFVPRGP
jgi:hypothetical protein